MFLLCLVWYIDSEEASISLLGIKLILMFWLDLQQPGRLHSFLTICGYKFVIKYKAFFLPTVYILSGHGCLPLLIGLADWQLF